MSSSPLLSVVVPFYNVADYIGETLSSLENQCGFNDFEVILIDDGSLDDSLSIAQRYVDRDPRFNIIRQANAGLGPARNTGTQHARGKYIAYVDSDDLVAPRAFALMVGSLEETGSDFAAANAKRFDRGSDSRQSWTHRVPFSQTRLRTNIREFPALVGDRMVWNKVYRRSFLDKLGIPFPAIRYEDYPFTLPAHLAATSVDVLSYHAYYWRVRESGDSITQQLFDLGNLRDRVTSALMVLDEEITGRSTDEIRHRLHAYFMEVDLLALAKAIALASPATADATADLAAQLARRLDQAAASRAPRVAQVVHQALLDGDLSVVRQVGAQRLPSRHRPPVRNRLRAQRKATDSQMVRKLPQLADLSQLLRPRSIKGQLRRSFWTDEALHLHVHIPVHPLLGRVVQAKAWLAGPSGTLRLTTTARPGAEGITLDAEIPTHRLDQLQLDEQKILKVGLWIGPVRWHGLVSFDSADLPGSRLAPSGAILQVGDGRQDPARLAITKRKDAVLVEVSYAGKDFILTFGDLPDQSCLRADRPAPTRPLSIPVNERTQIPATTFIADDAIDDPIRGRAERRFTLQATSAGGSHEASPHKDTERNRLLLLTGEPKRIEIPGHRLTLGANYDGELTLFWEGDR